jgi:hypothetical protein
MTHPTDDEIMELAGSWFHTGENQKRDDGYYYRSLGTPSNVRGSDLIEFARALLAEQARTEPDLDTQRADFHKWCATNGYKTDFVEGGECPMGLPVYADHKTHAAWWAFQKAAKLYAAPLLKAEQAKDAAEDAELLDRYGKIRGDLKASAYCVGNEYKPFHPSASHVRPEWRDGWNACYVAAIRAARAAERKA